MTFKNGAELYDAVAETDLYNDEKCLYVFLYNDLGSICVYDIQNEEALNLEEKSKVNNEYWGAFLGAGGAIFDEPMEFCNAEYTGEWRCV